MRVLVTGGAGFIGNHLVRRLVDSGYEVRVLDNFSTGSERNLDGVDAEVVTGDIRSLEQVAGAVRGMNAIFHVAALPSVARSWSDPVLSLHVNALGSSNVLEAALEAGVEAVVYSSSSSVYGDQQAEVKTEDLPPNPISPYGHAKLMGEKLTVAHSLGLKTVALRYFNVFGPRQDPDSPYSAVIPLFIKHAINGTVATINGDGNNSRDFTYVDNVVDANLQALQSGATGVVANVACGQSHSLLDLVGAISEMNGKPLHAKNGPPRPGDIKHSLAGLRVAREKFGYEPRVSFREGLRLTYDWYRAN